MTLFAPMDDWIVAAGSSDGWLSLGLDLLDGWQGDAAPGGQAHLTAVLASLGVLRPARSPAPDPVALAVWFHHSGAAAAYDALLSLTGQTVAAEVARLVRVLGDPRADGGDLAGAILCAAHRRALSAVHLSAVPPEPSDQ